MRICLSIVPPQPHSRLPAADSLLLPLCRFRRNRLQSSGKARRARDTSGERLVKLGDVNHFINGQHMGVSTSLHEMDLPLDQLKTLRAILEHFEQSPDFGDSENVEAIRQHLKVRIREAEGALRCPPWLDTKMKAEAA